MTRKLALLLTAAAFGGPAHAEWRRAESRHFIIYANDRESALRADAERLERFDQAVRAVRKMDDPDLPSGGKVSLFVVPLKTVQDLAGSKNVYGFYNARAAGSTAFVPFSTGSRGREEISADQVFFHEYAHHLMVLNLQGWAPVWLREGFAEFYASPAFEADGTVVLGQSPAYRSWGINQAFGLPLATVLADKFERIDGEQGEALYGRGWALTHLLTFEPSRQGQLSRYLRALGTGTEPLGSATAAFGDLKQLDRDISAYANRGRLQSLRVPGAMLKVGAIEVRELGPSADRIMPLLAKSRAGIEKAAAPAQAVRLRGAAAAFPTDTLAQLALAEAENDAGNWDAAIAAATRVLALQPSNIDAMMLKADALLSRAETGKTASKDRLEARGLAAAANKLAPEDPEPLIHFYDSFVGLPTPAAAFDAIHYALVLAPFDTDLRLKSAMARMDAKQWAEARATLQPLAHNVHAPGSAKVARTAIAAIDRNDGAAAIAAMTSKADDAD